jgi:hypothetical protein
LSGGIFGMGLLTHHHGCPGIGFSPHSKEVFERCIRIIKGTYALLQTQERSETGEEPDRDFYIVALDLMAGVVQGLGPSSESLVQMYQTDVLQCLNVTLSVSPPNFPSCLERIFCMRGKLNFD